MHVNWMSVIVVVTKIAPNSLFFNKLLESINQISGRI